MRIPRLCRVVVLTTILSALTVATAQDFGTFPPKLSTQTTPR